MFEEWSGSLSALDVRSAPEAQVRMWLAYVAAHQGALDAFVARCATRLGESSSVRGATRCTQREADRAVARGALIEAVPEVGSALADGTISGAHVDALARAADRTSAAAVEGSSLLALATAKPADAMSPQITDFIRTHARDEDEAARLARQRANRRAFLVKDDMGVLHAEYDDTTYGQIRSALDAETDRLYYADGGRDGGGDARTPEQRRADALAGLILGKRSAQAGPPAVRNQMTVVAHQDGTGHIPGVGALPRSEVDRLKCISDLYGTIFSTDGQPLWMGDRVRLATDDQWRALIARDGGCIGCGADPSRCEAHHVIWVHPHRGATDIDNLVLVCGHHHHLIHDKGWQITRTNDGKWALAPP